LTASIVAEIQEFIDRHLTALDIHLIYSNGADFLDTVETSHEVKSVIFTDSWHNLRALRPRMVNKKLIYCGSGVNPFVVAGNAGDSASVGEIADIALRSRIYNSGQDCLCAERYYVSAKYYDEFTSLLTKRMRETPVGEFGDQSAKICPLLGGIADNLEHKAKMIKGKWIIEFEREDNIVKPSIVEVPIDSRFHFEEKFGPLITLSRYETEEELEMALPSDHRFGATVCGAIDKKWAHYFPHLTSLKSVMDFEAESLHVPFGGCGKAGFVSQGEECYDGPILYSVETTESS
jgi:acyl-CoA reductase-like NAD-dependent aldehyde dehydrogenase